MIPHDTYFDLFDVILKVGALLYLYSVFKSLWVPSRLKWLPSQINVTKRNASMRDVRDYLNTKYIILYYTV